MDIRTVKQLEMEAYTLKELTKLSETVRILGHSDSALVRSIILEATLKVVKLIASRGEKE
jgi:hypothetical protein